MKDSPLVSVISVIYNIIDSKREEFFIQCLESVHNQTYSNLEHIIVDGGSTDGTVEMLEKYVEKGWIRYISEKDTSIYDAMNKGVMIAKGKYVAFINSDDFYHNQNGIEYSVNSLEKSNAVFSYAPVVCLDEVSKKEEHIVPDIHQIFVKIVPCHQTMLTKREILLKEGLFDTRYKVVADYDLTLRMCLKNYPSIYVDTDFVTYRLGGYSYEAHQKGILREEVTEVYYSNYQKIFPIDRTVAKQLAENLWYEECNSLPLNLAIALKKCIYFSFDDYIKSICSQGDKLLKEKNILTKKLAEFKNKRSLVRRIFLKLFPDNSIQRKVASELYKFWEKLVLIYGRIIVSKNSKWLPIIIIFVLWALTILPSAINSNWFFYDDPSSVVNGITVSQNLDGFVPTSIFGRYVPIHWYYRGIIFRLFGNIPTPAYLIQSLSILGTLFLIYWIVKTLTKFRSAGLITCLLFLTGSGISENAYTLSKLEPIVLASILVVIAGAIILYKNKVPLMKKVIFFLLTIAFTIIAIWSKEPSLLIIILGAGLLAGAILYKTKNYFPALAIILGVILSRLPQIILRPSDLNDNYTNIPINATIIKTNITSYLQQNPDYAILLILSFILISTYVFKTFKKPVNGNIDKLSKIIIISLFIFACAYTCILLVWRWPLGYYLYVPLGILSIVFSVLLYQLRFSYKYISKKVFLLIGVILLLTRLISIPYNIYTATAQNSLSSVYTTAVKTFIDKAPINSRLLFENWDFYSEGIYQTNLLINNIYKRPDLKVEGISDLVQNRKIPDEILELYELKGIPDSLPRWPKQDDYVLVLTSNLTTYWRIRGVMPAVTTDTVLTEKGYELELVSESQNSFRLPFLESQPQGYIWRMSKTFQGYKLYKVTKAPENLKELSKLTGA